MYVLCLYRTSIGTSVLPLGVPIEIDAVVDYEE